MVQAWLYNETKEDQRAPHKQSPNVPVSLEELKAIGVSYWNMDADNYESDPALQALREENGFSYSDVICVSPEKLPGYEEKIKSFFEEHLHTDDEIRYILEGSGYFDVRSATDQWIRIFLQKGDMISLPEGIYHRFTLDDTNYIKAMRLFKGDPVWTPLNRPQDDSESRKGYVTAYLGTQTSPTQGPSVQGFVAPGFEEVRRVFQQNFTLYGEVGAACCIYLDGKLVVDIWGGDAEKATASQPAKAWEQNTLCNAFSITKAMTNTCLTKLVDDGHMAFTDPISKHWPEFGCHGKQDITVSALLSHQGGLPFFEECKELQELKAARTLRVGSDGQITLGDSPAAREALSTFLANQKPVWPATGKPVLAYHALSVGLFATELLTRVDPQKRSVHAFFRDAIARPASLDYHIGLPLHSPHVARLAQLYRVCNQLPEGGVEAGSQLPPHVQLPPGTFAATKALAVAAAATVAARNPDYLGGSKQGLAAAKAGADPSSRVSSIAFPAYYCVRDFTPHAALHCEVPSGVGWASGHSVARLFATLADGGVIPSLPAQRASEDRRHEQGAAAATSAAAATASTSSSGEGDGDGVSEQQPSLLFSKQHPEALSEAISPACSGLCAVTMTPRITTTGGFFRHPAFPEAFFHTGLGGSVGWADPKHRLGWCYLCNCLETGKAQLRRESMIMAVYRCVNAISAAAGASAAAPSGTSVAAAPSPTTSKRRREEELPSTGTSVTTSTPAAPSAQRRRANISGQHHSQ